MTEEEDVGEGARVVVVQDGLLLRQLAELHVEDPFEQEFVLHGVVDIAQGMVDKGREEFVDGAVSFDALLQGNGKVHTGGVAYMQKRKAMVMIENQNIDD